MHSCYFRALATCCIALGLARSAAADAPRYEFDVAPLLRTYCAGCHRDDEAEGEFSVETFAALQRGGAGEGAAVVPGDLDASALWRRVNSDADDHMPPRDQPQPTAAELEVLRAWIAAGAPGPQRDRSLLSELSVPELPSYAGPPPIAAVAYAPDFQQLAVARGRTVVLAAVDSAGACDLTAATTLAETPGKVLALSFSGDGKRLLLAGGVPGLAGRAEVRDVATGELRQTFAGGRDVFYDAEWSPDERLVAAAGYDGAVRIWDAASGALLHTIEVHNGAVFDLAWHPSGKLLASASADETVKLWRVSDAVRLDTLSQPQAELVRVAFAPSGEHILAAGRDKQIYLWSLTSFDEPAINPLRMARFAHEAPIVALAATPDGRHLASAAEDGTLSWWSLPELAFQAALPRQPDVPAALACSPLGLAVGSLDGSVQLLPLPASAPAELVTATTAGDAPPPPVAATPSRSAASAPAECAEQEPNDEPARPQPIALPAVVRGNLGAAGDADCFAFSAAAGEQLLLEIDAARSGSELDSRLEVLDAQGNPVPRVVLQATRDSWFTFRGKDSQQSGDFRLHNWMEMELDQYLYAGGEVVRLWLYPRGPDSGFIVYPGFDTRHAFFDTTPLTHALGEPAWIVRALPADADPPPNGLPVFTLYYENDDESQRRLGSDSQLLFTAPAAGRYVVRVTDVRGFGSDAEPDRYRYALALRAPVPGFEVRVSGRDPRVAPGSGVEVEFVATRKEGFAGPIRLDVENLPSGWEWRGPIEIEPEQYRARGVLWASESAVDPDETADRAVRVVATALVSAAHGSLRETTLPLGDLGNLQVVAGPRLGVEIDVPADARHARRGADGAWELVVRPGETISARVRAVRHGHEGRIEFGTDEAGRNLPFGVFVDNIGLNGLLIVEGQTEREFFITASPAAKPDRRLFHLRANVDGAPCSRPLALVVEATP